MRLGDGPPYYKFGRWIRYAREDLRRWRDDLPAAAIRPTTKSEPEGMLLVTPATAARFLTVTLPCLRNYRLEGRDRAICDLAAGSTTRCTSVTSGRDRSATPRGPPKIPRLDPLHMQWVPAQHEGDRRWWIGTGGRTRTDIPITRRQILSLLRLPIPPHPHADRHFGGQRSTSAVYRLMMRRFPDGNSSPSMFELRIFPRRIGGRVANPPCSPFLKVDQRVENLSPEFSKGRASDR